MPKAMTSEEEIHVHMCGLCQLDRMVSSGSLTLQDFDDQLPGWLHLNFNRDMGLCWMSGSMEKDLDTGCREAVEQGPPFLKSIIHDASTMQVMPRLKALKEAQNVHRVTGFVQMIRRDSSHPYLPYYTTVKLSKDQDFFVCQTVPLRGIEDHAHRLLKLMDLDGLRRKYFSRFQQLTPRETEILQMIAQGRTNREIGEILYISAFTVKTHRRNILRKLDVSRLHELIKIAMAHGLV